jgi:hypothetical protein
MNTFYSPEYRQVTYLSYRGYPYSVLERVMPRIRDELLDCVVYLYRSRREAERGEHIGGSGFLVFIEIDANHYWLYAVTNEHVIRGGATVIRLNTAHGDFDIIEAKTDDWIKHPKGDDVAMCSISVDPDRHKFKAIPIDQLMTPDLMQKTHMGPGDETYLIGRFINHEGRQKNLPTVRAGIVSMMPWEKIETERGQKEGFLVEVKSIGGYSGSPVIISIPSARYEESSYPFGSPQGQKAFLLGIDCGHIIDEEKVSVRHEGKKRQTTNYFVQRNTGMAIVVPAWKILDVLNCDELRKPREEYEEEMEHKRLSSGIAEDFATSGEPPSTQKTGTGLTIPVPMKSTVMDNLQKITRKKSDSSRSEKS